MGLRLDLQTLLETLGAEKVYFQPPSSQLMEYPCIRYTRSFVDIKHADNKPYANKTQYMVTVIYEDPDSTIPDSVANLPTCRFNRHFIVENLHHEIYYIYF